MSQAAESTTVIPLHPASRVPAFPPLQAAHAALVAGLAQLRPNDIRYIADRFDVMARRDHVKDMLSAVTVYVKAVIADTRYCGSSAIDDESGFLVDASADIVAAFNREIDRNEGWE
jgi:hypothetical protein